MSLKLGAEKEGGIMHRTMTLDVLVIIEGEIEIHLDSGEKKVVKAGDSIAQRAAMHKWANVTPNNGWARWVVFMQAAANAIHTYIESVVKEEARSLAGLSALHYIRREIYTDRLLGTP
ncbi:hypothetical protein P171DRAFT_472108 [Karstenula rhodostoma CBS 690.94]|uniref:Uncharacterized protein n=1 Tax=Karstenula rhodostoma CBS 690.94 TaxID=1392251 RepID=A0A9P4PPQ8_9PLEO|nr:hypothetical protein P171DRAFT_472108 [Karstenula rhodostoma CBS 690.94]